VVSHRIANRHALATLGRVVIVPSTTLR